MSNLVHHSSTEHKSLRSYVIGFILSLIFTLIPYYIVVNQLATGMTLLITILSFAFVQLIVQVVFFLHLGRGPKPNWNLYFFIGTIGAIFIVVAGSVIITSNLHNNLASTDQTKRLVDSEGIYQVGGELTGACQGRQTNHRVEFENGNISPTVTVASRCDSLTFIDSDGADVEVTFGVHKDHSVYAGLEVLELKKNRSKTITLSQAGTYQFHDDKRPTAVGTLAVYDDIKQ